jgi:3-demethoxyubiquinol 3-hydroxylase
LAHRRITANILRVNHAGEYGAIRIYQGQLWVAKWRAADLVPTLREILDHEKRHRTLFSSLMKAHSITPCRTLAIWGVGGFSLGLVTGLLGRQAILTCTAAVERIVHRHLDDQLRWLGESEPDITEAIAAVQAEELGHLDWAESGRSRPGGALDGLIAFATGTLIWLSTYGASGRMRKAIGPPAPPTAQSLSARHTSL